MMCCKRVEQVLGVIAAGCATAYVGQYPDNTHHRIDPYERLTQAVGLFCIGATATLFGMCLSNRSHRAEKARWLQSQPDHIHTDVEQQLNAVRASIDALAGTLHNQAYALDSQNKKQQ